MPRAIPEWIGRTDDADIPDRVKLRVWNRSGGHCGICTRKLMAGEAKHFDHKTALIDGGRHSETNLQIACVACHADKTAAEATERAKVRAKSKAVLGIRTAPVVKIKTGQRVVSERTAKNQANPKQPLPPRPMFRQVTP